MADIYEKYESSPLLTEWAFDHQPAKTLLWGAEMAEQVSWMRSVAPRPRCISTHLSKSVSLPVASWRFGAAVVVLRDNFYDINVAVVSASPIVVPLGAVHTIVDASWLAGKMRSCAEYEEIGLDDPVFDTDEWLNDFSGKKIIRQGNDVAVAPTAFAQGIEVLPGVSLTPYRRGCSGFIAAMDRERAAALVGLIKEGK